MPGSCQVFFAPTGTGLNSPRDSTSLSVSRDLDSPAPAVGGACIARNVCISCRACAIRSGVGLSAAARSDGQAPSGACCAARCTSAGACAGCACACARLCSVRSRRNRISAGVWAMPASAQQSSAISHSSRCIGSLLVSRRRGIAGRLRDDIRLGSDIRNHRRRSRVVRKCSRRQLAVGRHHWQTHPVPAAHSAAGRRNSDTRPVPAARPAGGAA